METVIISPIQFNANIARFVIEKPDRKKFKLLDIDKNGYINDHEAFIGKLTQGFGFNTFFQKEYLNFIKVLKVCLKVYHLIDAWNGESLLQDDTLPTFINNYGEYLFTLPSGEYRVLEYKELDVLHYLEVQYVELTKDFKWVK